jgi:hypothetical protein
LFAAEISRQTAKEREQTEMENGNRSGDIKQSYKKRGKMTRRPGVMHAVLITGDQRGNKENDPLAGQVLKERRVKMQERKSSGWHMSRGPKEMRCTDPANERRCRGKKDG